MVFKTKSHLRVTYLDTNNFYGWTINVVCGSNLKSVKSNKSDKKNITKKIIKVTTSQIINKCV